MRQKRTLWNITSKERATSRILEERINSGSRKCRFYESEGEVMNITYERCGDYLIPNIVPDPEPEGELRKFGLMRKSYLGIKDTPAFDTGTGRGKI